MFFSRMKYVYTLALAVTISSLITTDYGSPAGDTLVGVLACSVAVMMRGETVVRKAELRARYYQARYRNEISVRMERVMPGEGPSPDPRALTDTSLPVSPIPHSTRMPWCSPDTCSNAMHYPTPAVSPMPLEDIERSQGA